MPKVNKQNDLDKELGGGQVEFHLPFSKTRAEVQRESDEAALQLPRLSRFDLVLSDMQMPGMNGIDPFTEVSKLHPQTLRLIISGFMDRAVADALK